MEYLDPTSEASARELLSGLIQQRSELGSLGTALVLLMLCAGIEPAQKTAPECQFHTLPPPLQ